MEKAPIRARWKPRAVYRRSFETFRDKIVLKLIFSFAHVFDKAPTICSDAIDIDDCRSAKLVYNPPTWIDICTKEFHSQLCSHQKITCANCENFDINPFVLLIYIYSILLDYSFSSARCANIHVDYSHVFWFKVKASNEKGNRAGNFGIEAGIYFRFFIVIIIRWFF
jgi:hypothetical protein